MGVDLNKLQAAWLESLSEEELAKHFRGKRPFTHEEGAEFLRHMRGEAAAEPDSYRYEFKS